MYNEDMSAVFGSSLLSVSQMSISIMLKESYDIASEMTNCPTCAITLGKFALSSYLKLPCNDSLTTI